MNRIKIHNFGPIRDVDIELSKFMTFIGPQGVGKSTIAKLLTIFSDVLWWRMVCDNDNPMSEFKKMGIDKYFSPDTTIDYYGRDGEYLCYKDSKFSISMKNLSSEEVSLLCKAMIVSSMEERLKKFDIDIKNLTTDKTAGKYRKFMRAYLRFICYIPAERNLAGAISSSLANIILSKTPLPNTLLEYISLFERAKNHYSTYDASFLGIKYEQDKGADCISLIGNNDKSLPLEACSSGIQSVLPMLMVMDYAREDKCFDTFIVEEPEQNLFPINQREILNRLISLTHKKDCRSVIINTHSPYILSALNVSMLAAKLSSMEQYKSDVAKIVPPQYHINSSDVSVFSLGEEPFCKSIIDKKTGLVSINDLDVLSEAIGSDFNRLYQLYLKSLQK